MIIRCATYFSGLCGAGVLSELGIEMDYTRISVANLAFFPQHWACFGGYLRDFFVSCGLRIFGLVLTTLAGFWAFPKLWAIIPPADVT